MIGKLPKSSQVAIYPAYCFAASPTYNAWVKLTAADVHKLRQEPGYQGLSVPQLDAILLDEQAGQNVYFHLNHPIRYVRLVGTIIAIDEHSGKSRLCILTIDDGSGQTIGVKIKQLPPEITNSIDCPSNTTVDNVNLRSGIGAEGVLVDGVELDIGMTVKVKCTISKFREIRQLELERISIVRDTNDEVKAWFELAAFRTEILSKPWELAPAKVKKLEDDAKAISRTQLERQARKAKHIADKATLQRAYNEERRAREDKLERRRRREEVMMNAGALPGSNVIVYPWE